MLYLVRHCEASGREPEAPLTTQGLLQAEGLAKRFPDRTISRVISSPYLRARQTIQPLAALLGLPVEKDERLRERTLGFDPHWPAGLRRSFQDPDFKLPGGESSRAATERALACLAEITAAGRFPVAICTHGQLLTLIRKHLEPAVGFDEWQATTNPDVFSAAVKTGRLTEIRRIWV